MTAVEVIKLAYMTRAHSQGARPAFEVGEAVTMLHPDKPPRDGVVSGVSFSGDPVVNFGKDAEEPTFSMRFGRWLYSVQFPLLDREGQFTGRWDCCAAIPSAQLQSLDAAKMAEAL